MPPAAPRARRPTHRAAPRRLDEPKGKNDGSVGGVAYFKCSGAGVRGVFVRPDKITLLGASFPKTPATAAPAGGNGAGTKGSTDLASKPAPAGKQPAGTQAGRPGSAQKNRECCFYIPGCTLNKR